ncbi:MAG: type VI secretion system tip protein TssI/VgrG [Polyangiaceae bacterium]
MSPNPSPNLVPVRLTIDAPDMPSFQVVECRARFAVSELFDVRIVAYSSDNGASLNAVMRQPVTVALEHESRHPLLRGIVRRAHACPALPGTEPRLNREPSERSADSTGLTRWELRIAPSAWVLGKRRNHRIFANATTVEIASTLLDEHRCSALAPGTAARPRREYTVQYGETDLHALLRLLTDDGYVVLPDLPTGSLRVVLSTSDEGEPAFPIPFVPASALAPVGPAVLELDFVRRCTARRAVVVDYDAENPNYVIEGECEMPTDPDPEHYAFEVGEVRTGEAAEARARDVARGVMARNSRVRCASTLLLAPGTKFTLTQLPFEAQELELLVVEARSEWTRDASGAAVVRHELDCCLAGKPYRTKKIAKPRIPGVQTAKVVGAPGSEIDVDEQGRVEVEFHWDRRRLGTLGASRRVRVAQGWAGVGHGIVTFPRVGDEVVVAYLDGDADQPLVVGSVHNPTRPNPLTLPADKTLSVWRTRSSPGGDGFNEIRMDDRAGGERFTMHAQRDFESVVERDATTTVGRSETRRIGGDFTQHTTGTGEMRFREGLDLATSKRATVCAEDLTLNTKNETHDVEDSFVLSASDALVSATGVTIAADSLDVMCRNAITLSVGGSSITIRDGEITLHAASIRLNA